MFARQLNHVRSFSATPLLPLKEQTTNNVLIYSHRRSLLSSLRWRNAILFVIGLVSLGSVMTLLTTDTTSMIKLKVYDHLPQLALSNPVVNVSQFDETQSDDSAFSPRYLPWVMGPPTQKFRDNLRSDRKYITSWYAAGWNNDVITMMNLIYLAKITERIPIVPTFTPSWHIGGDAPGISFGEIFDVTRFTEEAGVELLEWKDVKDPASEEIEDIGCWSVWQAVQKDEAEPRGSDVPKWLHLDIAYTKAPEWIKMLPNNEHDKGSSFWALARLAFSRDRNLNLRADVLPSPIHGVVVDPDEHLVCYDYLYYVGSHEWFEYGFEYAPGWRDVGTHLHWTQDIETLAAQYVNHAFGLPENQPVPPYITIHARHGDFGEWCWEAESPDDCFAPLSAIARRVQEVQEEVLERHGINIPMQHVVMTSDENDEAWWEQVASYGWKRIDHAGQRTAERYSRWHPLVIDSAIQSNGLGFVGTDRSTFSVLSRRRVMDWHDGATRMVFWGKKGADDH